MKLHVIYAQRKEHYPGEYAPEVLDAIDEYGNDDNPEWLVKRLADHKTCGEYESVVVVTLKVNGAQIMEILRPAAKVLPAEIVAGESNS